MEWSSKTKAAKKVPIASTILWIMTAIVSNLNWRFYAIDSSNALCHRIATIIFILTAILLAELILTCIDINLQIEKEQWRKPEVTRFCVCYGFCVIFTYFFILSKSIIWSELLIAGVLAIVQKYMFSYANSNKSLYVDFDNEHYPKQRVII